MKALWYYKYKAYVEQGQIEKAKQLLLKKIPKDKIVYKYFRGINRDWNCITKPELWLCQAGKFNDPFDCAFLYNCRSKEKYNPKTEYDLAVSEGLLQFDRDKESKAIQESVFIACFSEKNNSMLMWSHYGDEHRGICVGYNLRELIMNYNCFPVIYSTKMPQEKDLNILDNNMLYQSILTKSEDWKYEFEWRIIDIDRHSAGKNGKRIEFVKPVSIYMGQRQQNGVSINHKKYNKIKGNDPNADALNAFKSDDFYVDINKIINYKRTEKIELYDFDLSRNSFNLIPRSYRRVN